MDQWIDTWRAERRKVMHTEVITDGTAKRAKLLEAARCEMRKRIFKEAKESLEKMAKKGDNKPEIAVILSFIQVIRKIAPHLLISRPIDILEITEKTQKYVSSSTDEKSDAEANADPG